MTVDQFAPYRPHPTTKFIVRNITPDRNKTIKIFLTPIGYLKERDLLKISGVAESDIRASLLKGELLHKLLAKDIVIVDSDIDLLQFNDDQKAFLQESGIIKGLEVAGGSAALDYAFRQEIPLIGLKNGVNRTFYTPDKFINGYYSNNIFHISIKHNGKDLYENIDYTIGESIVGQGYDVINLTSLTPNSHSLLFADYVIKQ